MDDGVATENLTPHDGASALAAFRQQNAPAPEKTEADVADGRDEAAVPEGEEVGNTEPESSSEPEATEGEEQPEADEAEPEVLVNGQRMTAEEFDAKYVPKAEFTRKTQALADERKQAAAQHAEAMTRVATLLQVLDQQVEREPDWAARVDAVGADDALKEQIAWQSRQRARELARYELEQTQKTEASQRQIKAREVLASGEFEKSWTDPETLNKALGEIGKYAGPYGWTPDVLNGLADPNVFVVLEKARRYDELQKAKPKAEAAVKAKPKPIRPAAQAVPPKEKDRQQVMNRFHQTKTEEDGLAALRSLRQAS